MLDYAKKILSKVSFDQKLFKHELGKFVRNTQDESQRVELKNWVTGNFDQKYSDAIRDVFDGNTQQSVR